MKKHFLLPFALLLLAAGALSAQTLPSVVEVYQIFQAKCVSCHDHASPEAGLDLEGTGATELGRAVNVAQKLVNIAPTNTYAAALGHKRIAPGRPDRSFLFRKVNAGFEPHVAALHADEGQSMPAYPGTALTAVEKEIVRQWILFGAKTGGIQFSKAVVEDFYANGGDKSFPDGPPPAPAPGEGFQIKMGPFYLAPNGEIEYYQKYALSLPANVEVNRLSFALSPYSHHFLLYNFTGTGAAAIPDGLRTNANHSSINLVAAVQEATDLQLPGQTAFRWNNNIVLDLNSHYINYSLLKPYQCEVYVNIYTQAPGTAEHEMFADLLVNPSIPIPNNGNTITHTASEYQLGADSIYVWGLMGHTHKYGTGYKVWKRLPNGQKGEQIYDAACPQGVPGCFAPMYDYQHIPLRYWEPLLPIRWSHGIVHEATWVNDGPSPVNFGPTSDDEMMVLIAFYTLAPLTTGSAEPTVGTVQPIVAPNPAHDRVAVTLPGRSEVRDFRLFDANGKMVLRRSNLTGNTVELSLHTVPAGLYWFNADGLTGKIVRY
jgi:hypothetical protein